MSSERTPSSDLDDSNKHHSEAHDMIDRLVPGMISKAVDPAVARLSASVDALRNEILGLGAEPIVHALQYTFLKGENAPLVWRIDSRLPLPRPAPGERISVVAPHTNFEGEVRELVHQAHYVSGPTKSIVLFTEVIVVP
jgi:hypothetical protein